MNVPDLRNVDFDGYRQRALDLRAEAMDAMIDRAIAALRSRLAPRPRPIEVERRVASAPCTA